ncbi:Serine/threonine-protein kinase ark1 [Tritrichomonas foetus]|uniref:Serine/threonine-protein kinase ark1 n=1 Tax=Tritrichomonas foetus TaxID=1144522 RepID=A0A1J4J4I6_9EUKA|nr:Serine/threonine-protein kinase ark1 [Tritrichomonas foetus]|eukprot:OHS94272.1 Serine/threonine-protein kinase ark1 [Tritrichomonas foetus]
MIPNNFNVLQRLVKGETSCCYLCEDIDTKQKVVLKVIPQNKISRDVFEKEVEITKILSTEKCSSLVKIERTFSTKDSYIIVMEPGQEDMFSYIKRHGTLSEKKARQYFYYIALALKFLHIRKIIHHDVKLENIILMKDGKVKLIDFDFCEKLNNSSKSTVRRGTVKYTAPEILCMKPHTTKADIWSLGVTIFCAITDHFPFDGDNEYMYTMSVLSNPPDILLLKEKKVSEDFISLIKIMLEKDPEKRPSIEECLDFPWNVK